MGDILDWLICMVGAVFLVWAAAAATRSINRHYDQPGAGQ